MTKLFIACALALTTFPAFAQKKGCEELAAEIAAKLDAKGVKAYKIDIVEAGEVGSQEVVGSCEAGAKKITYKRDAAAKK